ncbi:DUF1883 domain-containing protein [Acinetobacter sp. NS-4]|uniref:DUF1883 domain-containing protein n=1 Tax=unclassified Acinetobacter TaxID=196816 RepID=UPI00307DF0BD
MSFTQYDLGSRKSGEIIEVTLTASANVRLMQSSDLNNYKNGRRHSYRGGLITRSPYRIAIPSSGRWYLTVDMQGLRGSTRSSIRILPSALPEARQMSLSEVPSLYREQPEVVNDHETFDVFISHASEDKDDFVREFATSLTNKGLKVWYDEFALKIGDSLRQKIDRGLAKSRVGLVVLSPSFIAKGWTNYELDGIVTRNVSGEQILLPVWHNLTKQQVIDFSPSLADKVARSTATHTVDEISNEIVDLINSHK